jgi:hypothetical protein
MRTAWIIRLIFLSLLALGAAITQPRPSSRWYKGNLHTHTLNSDGDSTPHEVATWYREHGYQFLTLSDHNYLTDVTGLNAVHAAREKFLLIPGEEVTDRFGEKHIHVNAYNLTKELQPRHGNSVAETIQNNVDMIRGAMALPSLNHPNYASSGVVLDDVRTGGGEYRIVIKERPTEKFTTTFIGDGGKVLAKSFDTKPVYKLAGNERYVRARVDSSFGVSAWTQPLFGR